MPLGNVQNYQGALDGVDEITIGGNTWVKVFVDATVATRTDGDVVIISGVKAASSTDCPVARTPATTAVAVKVGVMATWAEQIVAAVGAGGAATVVTVNTTPAGNYGWAQVKGYCPKCSIGAAVVVEHYLKAANGVFTAADDAAANQDGVTGISAKSFAVLKTATGGAALSDVYLLGHEVTI